MTRTDDLQKEIEAKASAFLDGEYRHLSIGESRAAYHSFIAGYRAALESRPADVTALALENAELREALTLLNEHSPACSCGFDDQCMNGFAIIKSALDRPPTHYARLAEAYRELYKTAFRVSTSLGMYELDATLKAMYRALDVLARVEAAERGEG